ncbi:MAG: sigma factor-like helix-turn-helix DNA-binding protein, partial [Desulfobulbus sp.]|nr:sigma factor-like helix-turn-helix DNA-binding protein [Desulfobulbus sp.]
MEAFDALLTCGVRDLDGLLGLTLEKMHNLGISSSIINELTGIQNEFIMDDNESDGSESEVRSNENDAQPFEENYINSISLENEIPIPCVLFEKLHTRTQNVLVRGGITTCEHVLKLQKHELYNIKGVGQATVIDIKKLQKKIANHYQLLSSQGLIKQIYKKNESNIKPKHPFQWIKKIPKEKIFNPAEPNDWSLLSQSLPKIFRINIPTHFDKDSEQFTIKDLGISTSELYKLRGIALFPEDPANFLFSMSAGYLAFANISEETLLVILSYLSEFVGDRNIHTTPVSLLNLSETAIYADIQISLFKNFRAPAFPNLDILVKNEGSEERRTWGHVGKLSERYVMERLGFTVLGLKVLANLWQNRNEALKIQNTILSGITVEAYCGFDQLVDSFARTVGKDERESAVLKGRLGLLNEGKMTLEALGQHENVSRERIRQIEKQLLSRVKKFKKISLLSYLWVTLDEFLTRNGGVCCVTELADLFRNSWKWPLLPSENALASLISMSANFKVVWSPPILIVKPNHQCVQCSEIEVMLKKAVEGQKNGMLSFESALTTMNEFCQRCCCKIYHE